MSSLKRDFDRPNVKAEGEAQRSSISAFNALTPPHCSLGSREYQPAIFNLNQILDSKTKESKFNLTIPLIEHLKSSWGSISEKTVSHILPKANPQSTNANLIVDIGASKVWRKRDLVKGITQLMRNCAVPYDERISNSSSGIARSGLWFIPTAKEIKNTLKSDGAQLLVLVKDNRLWGAYLYNHNIAALSGADKSLCEQYKQNFKRNENTRIGLVGVVAVDPLVERPIGEGGLGIARKTVYRVLHSLMVGESRMRELDVMLAYVWDGYFKNTAIKSHNDFGWKGLPEEKSQKMRELLRKTYRDPLFGKIVSLDATPIELDLRDARQAKLAEFSDLQKFQYLDLDPC